LAIAASCTTETPKREKAQIDRFLSGVWLDHLTQLRAQLAALKKDLPPAYPFLQTIADKEKPEEQHVWIRGDQNNPGDLAPALSNNPVSG
jgi:hypothetical protein